MIAPEMQRLLQILSNYSAATIDQTFRSLRGRDLIPTSPHGGPGILMTAEHATWALLALAIDRPPGKAAEVVATWGKMKARGDETPHKTLAGLLLDTLSDTKARLGIREIRIGREWPCATVMFGGVRAADPAHFGAKGHSPGFRAAPIRSDFVISGGALQQIAIDLADRSVAEIVD